MTTVRGDREYEDDELTVHFASYLSVKKSDRIIFHDQLTEEARVNKPIPFKINSEYNPNKIDWEKDVFEELIKSLELLEFNNRTHLRGKLKMVVHDINVAPKIIDPQTMCEFRLLIVWRTYRVIYD